MMVPTLTRLGRFSEWMRALMLGAAVVTPALWPPTNFYSLSGSLEFRSRLDPRGGGGARGAGGRRRRGVGPGHPRRRGATHRRHGRVAAAEERDQRLSADHR